ncbi:MAG: DUF5615 family PIN-like protein [Bacteroidota bacterium]|nr:DUF5615 family PIN-like protein [Bacteroidota bacterium]
MKLKILVDMNLSPVWVDFLAKNKFEAVHWSKIGDPKEKDSVILHYAKENGFIVFTNDLDFGALLAANQFTLPSVIQIRIQDVLPSHIGKLVVASLTQYKTQLENGALISIDESRQRARILPLMKK